MTAATLANSIALLLLCSCGVSEAPSPYLEEATDNSSHVVGPICQQTHDLCMLGIGVDSLEHCEKLLIASEEHCELLLPVHQQRVEQHSE